MAMFTGGTEAQSDAPVRSTAKEPGLSIVAAGLHVTGVLDTNGVVKVEGTVTGSVRAEGQVLVAQGGLVDGDIYTREAVIGGKVKGAIYADERVEVQATCAVHGDIKTKSIVVQEGAEVNGRIEMGPPNALERKREAGGPNDGKAEATKVSGAQATQAS